MEQMDVWQSANQMMRLYQAGAEMAAADRANAMLVQGNTNGFNLWTQVVWAIREMENKKPLALGD